ncbi:MAG: amidohydrolase [Syntrophomonadales bacterium]|jgi:imidazolonepropionase-like amidohydrolase
MIAIKDGTIVTVKNGTIRDGVILVEGSTIQEVGQGIAIPPSSTVIDAAGCYVVPGFIDAHCHVGISEEVFRIEGNDINETTDPITPYLQALDGVNLNDLAFDDAVRSGVTRLMVHPGSANVLGGQSVLLKSWSPTPMEMVYRHPWGLKAALGENPKRVYGNQNKAPKTRMANAALLREALHTASRNSEKEQLEPKDEFRQKALIRVIRREMPLWLHVHRADDILTALRIKDEFNIDMVLQHGTEAHLVADEIARRGVAVCLGPLLTNRAKVEMQEVSFRNVPLLQKAGIQFCLITDHPVIPIQYLGVCAALAVREGLDEETAIRALTWNPAHILGVDQELGSIEPGKKADIVIFDGHPLEVKSRVRQVLVDGIIWGG